MGANEEEEGGKREDVGGGEGGGGVGAGDVGVAVLCFCGGLPRPGWKRGRRRR
jgi:hypothetical protein